MKSREERNSQFFTEDQSLLENVATDSWLAESNEAAADYWPRDERRQDSVLLQLEEPEDRMKLALEREEQIGSIVQSIADLKHIFKVSYITILFCISHPAMNNASMAKKRYFVSAKMHISKLLV